ncbi:MAG: hypothetical protein R3C28_19935 [Pirellulaceae bacterium]
MGPDAWEAIKIDIAASNDKFVIVSSGIQEGDELAMMPRSLIAEVALPELTPEQEAKNRGEGSYGEVDEQEDSRDGRDADQEESNRDALKSNDASSADRAGSDS